MTGHHAVQRPRIVSRADDDAVDIGILLRKARLSIVDSAKYQIEAGHRLKAKKDELDRGQWLPWLEANANALGFDDRRTATRLMATAAKWGASVPFDETKALQISRETWGHQDGDETNSTGTVAEYITSVGNEWGTPAKYIELARRVLGRIDLDPASNAKAQQTVRATKYFTKDDSGLEKEWHGRIWLNPPYEPPAISDFAAKLCNERRAGRVTAAIMLTHVYSDRDWFQETLPVADVLCLTSGRIRFIAPDGITLSSPPYGQAFFYFGADKAAFTTTFSGEGRCLSLIT